MSLVEDPLKDIMKDKDGIGGEGDGAITVQPKTAQLVKLTDDFEQRLLAVIEENRRMKQTLVQVEEAKNFRARVEALLVESRMAYADSVAEIDPVEILATLFEELEALRIWKMKAANFYPDLWNMR